MRVCGGRKLAGFINRHMTEVVQKKGEKQVEEMVAAVVRCTLTGSLLFLGSTSNVCLAELMWLFHTDLDLDICVSVT